MDTCWMLNSQKLSPRKILCENYEKVTRSKIKESLFKKKDSVLSVVGSPLSSRATAHFVQGSRTKIP